MTKYEKAVNALNDMQPDTFIIFMKEGGNLVGSTLDKDLQTEVRVTFTKKDVELLARAYDLTLGKGYCIFGSRSVSTLIEKSATQYLNK